MLLENHNAISSDVGGNYQIANSLRFQSASSQYLSRTPASATNRKTWTWSGWVKRGLLSNTAWLFSAGAAGSEYTGLVFNPNQLQVNIVTASTNRIICNTLAVFRDPSAWYHIVLAVDTTQATNSNGIKIYINGVQQTLNFTTYTQNVDTAVNNTTAQTIGQVIGVEYFDGYLSEVNFIDGQALTPSSFGETDTLTGQWVAKKYTGTYGTNGFYLPFSNGTSTTTLGNDGSGNANNWTLTNFTRSAGVNDCWMNDVPSGNGSSVGGTQPNSNYAVLNPLSNAVAPVNANLRISASTGNYSGLASMTMPSGKWYWECVNTGGSVFPMFGIARSSLANAQSFWSTSIGYAYYYDGTKYNASTPTSYGASYTANDIIGVAFDADVGTLTFYKNNVSQGVAFTGLTQGDYCPAIGQGSGVLVTNNVNFGQRSFAYTPPSGFKALCTANLPAATIKKGNTVFDAVLITGSATVDQTAVVNFAPDICWSKCRSAAVDHAIYDVIRGGTNYLSSNATTAETTSVPNTVTFNSNGVTLKAGGSFINDASRTYVDWLWDAGSSTVTNTSGSISSQVRANPTAGVSIVTWTGVPTSTGTNTIGHGLGVAPKVIILKNRDMADNWYSYNSNLGNTAYIVLNTTAAQVTGAAGWGSTSPTSTVFTARNGSFNSSTSDKLIAYCFAEIAGFSKFGSYTGNGSADGPFVYTNLTPRFILIKRTDTTGNWIMWDTARNTYNALGEELYPNLSNAAATTTDLDVLSNGFKLRSTNAAFNASGGTYIYACFASNPFNSSNGF